MEDDINNEMKTIVLDEVDKLKEKLHKLENIVNKILKENQTLSAKVNNLENIVEKFTNSSLPNKNKVNLSLKQAKSHGNEQEETWLYCIPKGCNASKILKKLDVSSDAQTIEINVDKWENEVLIIIMQSGMLKNILVNFSKIHDFNTEYTNLSIKDLKSLLKKILGEILTLDLVFILRNLPKKNDFSYDMSMSNIATFSGILYNTYEEMEENNEALGNLI